MNRHIQHWFASGIPYVWLNAGAVSISVIMVVGLIMLIAVRGLGHFWPADVAVFDYYPEPGSTPAKFMGEFVDEETVSHARASDIKFKGNTATRYLIKTGNRDISGLDFRWLIGPGIQNMRYPDGAMIVERREWGNLYGFLKSLELDGKTVEHGENLWPTFQEAIKENNKIFEEIRHIEKDLIGSVNYKMERLRLKERGMELKGDKESVHLEDCPEVASELIDTKLLEQMEATRKIIEQALAVRAEAGIKVRQPLAKLYISKKSLPQELYILIKAEVNVKKVEVGDKLPQGKN